MRGGRESVSLNPVRVAAPVCGSGSSVTVEMAQSLPLTHAALHYRYGVPALGSQPSVSRLPSRLDAMLEPIIPRSFWAHVIVRECQTG
jgi:hypothetical protein